MRTYRSAARSRLPWNTVRPSPGNCVAVGIDQRERQTLRVVDLRAVEEIAIPLREYVRVAPANYAHVDAASISAQGASAGLQPAGELSCSSGTMYRRKDRGRIERRSPLAGDRGGARWRTPHPGA